MNERERGSLQIEAEFVALHSSDDLLLILPEYLVHNAKVLDVLLLRVAHDQLLAPSSPNDLQLLGRPHNSVPLDPIPSPIIPLLLLRPHFLQHSSTLADSSGPFLVGVSLKLVHAAIGRGIALNIAAATTWQWSASLRLTPMKGAVIQSSIEFMPILLIFFLSCRPHNSTSEVEAALSQILLPFGLLLIQLLQVRL